MERQKGPNENPPDVNPNDTRGEFIPETPSDITMEGNEKRDTDEGVEETESSTMKSGVENKGDVPNRRELWSPDDRFRESPIGDERLEK